MKFNILAVILIAIVGMIFSPKEAHAVIQSLNNQTGQTQTFANDTNVVINSANDVHTLEWTGLLPISRGGTGNDSFIEGSVIFMGQNRFRQDNNNFFWDRINNRLGIGTSSPTSALDVSGNASISGDLLVGAVFGRDAVTNNTDGEGLSVGAGSGLGSGNGGDLFITGGSGGETGVGGGIDIYGGRGGTTSGDGGPVNFFGGAGQAENASGGDIVFYGADGRGSGQGSTIRMSAGTGGTIGPGGHLFFQAGSGGQTSGNGGLVQFNAGNASGGNSNGGDIIFAAGQKSGTGTNGTFKFSAQSGTGILDLSLVANKTFTFPNVSGTFGLLQADQTWSGLNKFEADTNSTIYVGSSIKSGCIALGDSDSAGITYITANDGVLSASSTKPSICQ